MKKIDIAAALGLLALSALIVAETWDLPYWSTFTPGPAFASFWVAACGALIGIVLLVQALLTNSNETIDWPDWAGTRQVLLGAASIWLLFVLLPVLGTALAGLLFMMLFLLGIARRPLLPSLFTSVFTVGLLEVVFSYWLRIDLPQGPLGF